MTVVDIFRPDSAHDTLRLLMNWDGMGKMMLERFVTCSSDFSKQNLSKLLFTFMMPERFVVTSFDQFHIWKMHTKGEKDHPTKFFKKPVNKNAIINNNM